MNNQRILENTFIDYLLDALQSDSTDNTNLTATTVVDIINAYSRIIDTYNRNISDLISLLRTRIRNRNQSHTNRTRTTAVPPTSANGHRSVPSDTPRTSEQGFRTGLSGFNNSFPMNTQNTTTFFSRSGSSSNTSESQRAPQIPEQNNNNSPDRRLTQSEIQNEVSTIIYDNEQTTTTCPISLEEFTIGESVCKINACGHIFKQNSLITWFNNHSRCPVCRHNLVSSSSSETTSSEYTSSPWIRTRLSNPFNSITYRLLSSLNTNPEDIEPHIFTIPIYYDLSGNVL